MAGIARNAVTTASARRVDNRVRWLMQWLQRSWQHVQLALGGVTWWRVCGGGWEGGARWAQLLPWHHWRSVRRQEAVRWGALADGASARLRCVRAPMVANDFSKSGCCLQFVRTPMLMRRIDASWRCIRAPWRCTRTPAVHSRAHGLRCVEAPLVASDDRCVPCALVSVVCVCEPVCMRVHVHACVWM
jgi:hypothetical protein